MRLVYADVVLISNLLADYTALYITSRLSGLYLKKTKHWISSFAGAFSSLVLIIINTPRILQLVISFLISVFMIYLAFGKKSHLAIIKLSITLNVSGIIMSGFVTVFADSSDLLNSVVIMFVCFLVLAKLVDVLGGMLVSTYKSRTVKIKVTTSKKEGIFEVMTDSGNVLTDPLSGLSVVVLTNKAKRYLIGDDLESYKENRIRFIPIMTAGGTGCLEAFRPESFYIIDTQEKEHKIEAIVAFCSSEKVNFCDKDGVIPQLLIDNL